MNNIDRCIIDELKDGNIIDLKSIRSYLDMGADANAADNMDEPLLYKAVMYRNIPLIQLLIKYGADINKETYYESTPLYRTACINKDESLYKVNKIMGLFLKHGVNVDDGNISDDTALYVSSGNGNIKGIKLLLEYGANINASNCYGYTPLFEAVKNNLTDVVKVLIDRGAMINVHDEKGKTPLFTAVKLKQINMINLLIDHGASITIKDNKGRSVMNITNDTIIITILEVAIQNKMSY